MPVAIDTSAGVRDVTTATTELTSLLQGYIGQVNTYKTRSSIQYTINNYLAARDYGLSVNGELTNNSTVCGDYGLTDDGTNNIYNGLQYIGTNTTKPIYDGTTATIRVDAGTTEYVINVNSATNGLYNWGAWGVADNIYGAAPTPVTERDRKRTQIRSHLSPVVKTRSEAIMASTPQEAVAMEALRETVTEDDFKRYLRYGFVLVRGNSGATYQVYRNRSHVKVWVGGKVVEEICVYLRDTSDHGGVGKIPMTDKVVAFKAMIEADEEAFKKLGNCYRMAA
jgi:hypothetical protein